MAVILYFRISFSYSCTNRNVLLCHVCSELRDIYKKTGAWFYKTLPKIETMNQRGESVGCDEKKLTREERQKGQKILKTTKLGMEIESDEEDDEETMSRDDAKFIKSGSFGSGFLKNRNLFNLRLLNEKDTRLSVDHNNLSVVSKKSPVSPYSRQTSSSESQKSAVSLQQNLDWEQAPTCQNGLPLRQQRRSSVSSCYSITESLSKQEIIALNSSKVDIR